MFPATLASDPSFMCVVSPRNGIVSGLGHRQTPKPRQRLAPLHGRSRAAVRWLETSARGDGGRSRRSGRSCHAGRLKRFGPEFSSPLRRFHPPVRLSQEDFVVALHRRLQRSSSPNDWTWSGIRRKSHLWEDRKISDEMMGEKKWKVHPSPS